MKPKSELVFTKNPKTKEELIKSLEYEFHAVLLPVSLKIKNRLVVYVDDGDY